MSEWIEFLKLLQSLPVNEQYNRVLMKDLQPMANQIAEQGAAIVRLQHQNDVLLTLIMILSFSAIALVCALSVAAWWDLRKLRKQFSALKAELMVIGVTNA